MSNDEIKFQPIFQILHIKSAFFTRIGHSSCYHHWNEIFAGVWQELSREVRILQNRNTYVLPTAFNVADTVATYEGPVKTF